MAVKPENIFVYASYTFPDVNEFHIDFAQRCGYSVLTFEKRVFDICTERNLRVVLVPKNPFLFKLALRRIPISFLVLAGDCYHGRHNYLARHYLSAIIQGVEWNNMLFWDKRSLWPNHPFYFRLHHWLGLTATLFGKPIVMYEESFGGTLVALMEKVVWGLRNKSSFHGNFSDLIFLQADWEKEVFIKNGIPEKNIRVTGVIQADWMMEKFRKAAEKALDDQEPCDLLFFAQPLYQYSGEPHYLEELEKLVDEAHRMGLKMFIKLHPRDDRKRYERFEKKGCRLIDNVPGWRDEDNVFLIRHAKVVMGKGSTSMFAALVVGKPVMCLDLFDSDIVHFKHYFDLKLLLRKIEDFEAMYRFASDPKNQAEIQEHQRQLVSRLGFYDGQCWRRIKAEIEKFLI